jgi:hypothetical protein
MNVNTLHASLASQNFETVRQTLAQQIHEDSALGQRFEWARAATGDRSVDFVARHLRSNPPGMLTWPQISEHLRSLGYHLDQCQLRQEKLYELESACIAAVVDHLNAERMFDIDEALAGAEVAHHATVTTPERREELLGLVHEKFKLRRALFDYRMALYAAPGGSLNFNERIDLLRKLQADSVHAAYVRAKTVRHAMHCNGIAHLDPVPDWSTTGTDTLGELVLWTRRAIQSLESYLGAEKQVLVCVSSLRHWKYFKTTEGVPMEPMQLVNMLQAGSYDDLQFDFSSAMLLEVPRIRIDKPVRLLSAAIGLIFGTVPTFPIGDDSDKALRLASEQTSARNFREQRRGGARVEVPEQRADYGNGRVAYWRFRPIHLDDQVGIVESFSDAGMVELPTNRVGNINPFGTWKLSINDWLPNLRNSDFLSSWKDSAFDWQRPRGVALKFLIGFNEFTT